MPDNRRQPARTAPREVNRKRDDAPTKSGKARRPTRPKQDEATTAGEREGNPVFLLVGFVVCLLALLAWAMTAS